MMAKALDSMLVMIVEACILDGEVLAWDPDKQCYVPFGHNRTAAKKRVKSFS